MVKTEVKILTLQNRAQLYPLFKHNMTAAKAAGPCEGLASYKCIFSCSFCSAQFHGIKISQMGIKVFIYKENLRIVLLPLAPTP